MKSAFSTIRVASSRTLIPRGSHQRPQLADVGHAHRLAAGHVHRAGQRDVGDPLGADLADERARASPRSTLPLNGCERLRVVGLVDDHVVERRPGELLVEAGRREVHVPGHVVAGLDERLADEVLGAAALVGGHDVAVAVEALDGRLEVVVVAAPRVGLVAEHHPGPLAVAHRRRARVGQQVDVDVLAAEQERVVAGLGEGARRAGRRVVTVSGSTILIFQGSAQLRRPCCWPIVWSGSCAIGCDSSERSGRRGWSASGPSERGPRRNDTPRTQRRAGRRGHPGRHPPSGGRHGPSGRGRRVCRAAQPSSALRARRPRRREPGRSPPRPRR